MRSSASRLRVDSPRSSARASISEAAGGMSSGRSRRTAGGIWSNSSSMDPAPTAASIARTSSSVCGANLISGQSTVGREVRPFPSPRDAARADSAGQVLEAVLRHERQIVALIEDLALHIRVQLAQPTDLSVLLRHQLLVQRRDLDVEVVLRQVEVGRETLDDPAVLVPLEIERRRLVVPGDLIEVEQPGELALAGVRE